MSEAITVPDTGIFGFAEDEAEELGWQERALCAWTTEMLETRRGLGSAATAHPSVLCFATVYRDELLSTAATRRIRVDV